MHIFATKDNPPVYAGIVAVSLMILTGLTIAGTTVVLTVMIPVFVLLTPIILVPAVITTGFLAAGFLASGSLGASAIALLLWLYKYTLHARGVRYERAYKLITEGDKLHEDDTPPEGEKLAEQDKMAKEDHKPFGRDKSPERNKTTEEYKPLGSDKSMERDKTAKEDKPLGRDKSPERNKATEEDKPLGGVKTAEEWTSVANISKVLLREQSPIGRKCNGPSTSIKRSHQIPSTRDPTKARSTFMKEYQKIPRVGAFAYKYFTMRDKTT